MRVNKSNVYKTIAIGVKKRAWLKIVFTQFSSMNQRYHRFLPLRLNTFVLWHGMAWHAMKSKKPQLRFM